MDSAGVGSLGIDIPAGATLESLSQGQLDALGQELADRLVEVYGRDETLRALNECVGPVWPDTYVNRDTGKEYAPHHEAERTFVYEDTPRQLAALGGEGGGKSVSGIIKVLERLRRSCSGLMVSPDLPHFKRSLWPEFQRWCPWDQVVDKHKDRGKFDWEPYAPFVIAFRNGAKLWCGGMDEPGAWEGPNINFAHMDEMRRKKKADVLKVLDGRVRIPGPNGEPPQIWQTTTPRKHWLYEFYGPLQVVCDDCKCAEPIAIQKGEPFTCRKCGGGNLTVVDPRESFKRDSRVITLLTVDNEENLEENFAAKRAQTLTEAEARVLLEALWEDIEEGQRFLPHMSWWDDCEEELPILDTSAPLVLVADAATGRQYSESDCFGVMGITRHPANGRSRDTVAVRYAHTWQAAAGEKIDYLGTDVAPGPERELLRLCGWRVDTDGKYVRLYKCPKCGQTSPEAICPKCQVNTHRAGYNVKCIVYDPQQLHDLGMRFERRHIVWMQEFTQRTRRVEADTDLLHLIQNHRVVHTGDATLREHLDNADRKLNEGGKQLRIVKREDALKIDLAVCLSMGANVCLDLNLA